MPVPVPESESEPLRTSSTSADVRIHGPQLPVDFLYLHLTYRGALALALLTDICLIFRMTTPENPQLDPSSIERAAGVGTHLQFQKKKVDGAMRRWRRRCDDHGEHLEEKNQSCDN